MYIPVKSMSFVSEADAGKVCAVTGLAETYPGQGLGAEKDSELPILEPVLTYRIILPDDCNVHTMLRDLKLLEEEEPELHVVWIEKSQEIHVQLMGDVQIEILQRIIKERLEYWLSSGKAALSIKRRSQHRWKVSGILNRYAIMQRYICG